VRGVVAKRLRRLVASHTFVVPGAFIDESKAINEDPVLRRRVYRKVKQKYKEARREHGHHRSTP